MPLSKRTKKRFLILTAIIALLVIGAGAAFYARKAQLNKQTLAALDVGMAAYEKGDYEQSLSELGKYLSRHRKVADADTIYAYADSRLNVPTPNSRHLLDGIAILDQIMDIDPTHQKTIEALLELRVSVGQTLEAIKLADMVLEEDPTNDLAHETKIAAYHVTGNTESAIEAAQAHHRQKPDQIGVVRQLVWLMLQSPPHRRELAGEEGLLAKILEGNEENAEYQLLLAQAYRALEDPENAAARLSAAIALPADDDNSATSIASEIMHDRSSVADLSPRSAISLESLTNAATHLPTACGPGLRNVATTSATQIKRKRSQKRSALSPNTTTRPKPCLH